jgi:hypothetical protein
MRYRFLVFVEIIQLGAELRYYSYYTIAFCLHATVASHAILVDIAAGGSF